MSLNLSNKKAIITEITAKIKTAQTIIVAEYRGIHVSDLIQLYAKARNQGVYLRVLKNTLVRQALQGTIFANLISKLTGPLIYSISENAIAAAKVITDFTKFNDKLIVKAGNYAGKQLDEAAVIILGNIPSREVLLSKLLRIMQIPVISFTLCLVILSSKKTSEIV